MLNDRGTWRADDLAGVARACGRLLTASDRVL
jgi:hypothetical protein